MGNKGGKASTGNAGVNGVPAASAAGGHGSSRKVAPGFGSSPVSRQSPSPVNGARPARSPRLEPAPLSPTSPSRPSYMGAESPLHKASPQHHSRVVLAGSGGAADGFTSDSSMPVSQRGGGGHASDGYDGADDDSSIGGGFGSRHIPRSRRNLAQSAPLIEAGGDDDTEAAFQMSMSEQAPLRSPERARGDDAAASKGARQKRRKFKASDSPFKQATPVKAGGNRKDDSAVPQLPSIGGRSGGGFGFSGTGSVHNNLLGSGALEALLYDSPSEHGAKAAAMGAPGSSPAQHYGSNASSDDGYEGDAEIRRRGRRAASKETAPTKRGRVGAKAAAKHASAGSPSIGRTALPGSLRIEEQSYDDILADDEGGSGAHGGATRNVLPGKDSPHARMPTSPEASPPARGAESKRLRASGKPGAGSPAVTQTAHAPHPFGELAHGSGGSGSSVGSGGVASGRVVRPTGPQALLLPENEQVTTTDLPTLSPVSETGSGNASPSRAAVKNSWSDAHGATAGGGRAGGGSGGLNHSQSGMLHDTDRAVGGAASRGGLTPVSVGPTISEDDTESGEFGSGGFSQSRRLARRSRHRAAGSDSDFDF